jgi:hypothetical protein
MLTAGRLIAYARVLQEVAMSEHEIRSFLRALRERLDRAARAVLLPTALGAGLALAGCDDSSGPKLDAKVADGSTADTGGQDAATDGPPAVVDAVPKPEELILPYMAPDAGPLCRTVARRA